MQKPTLCIYKTTHAHWYVWAYKHPMGIYHYLFSITKFETSYIPRGQKQALANATKICLHPHPVISRQTPQRELRVQR